MLTPDTKATTYATGAVGTTANRIAKGTITWGDRHTSCSLYLPHLLFPAHTHPSVLTALCLVQCWALKTQAITDRPAGPQETPAPRSTSPNPTPTLASWLTHTDPEGRHLLPKSLQNPLPQRGAQYS